MKNYLLLTSALYLAAAFDNAATAGWAKTPEGVPIFKDGNPVYIDTTGAEKIVEYGTISRLNAEAKEHRTAKEKAEGSLKLFEGLDPEASRKAIELVGKLDQKKLIDVGEVDKVRDQLKGEFTTQLTEKDNSIGSLTSQINKMLVGDVFKSSQFVRDNIAVPQDMFEASFRDNFKVEDGKVVAYGKDGNRLLSKTRAGEFATPEEALHILVEQHPQKDVILKANVGNGTGNNGNGGNSGMGRNVTRAEFAKMSATDQATVAAKAGKGELKIVD